MKTVISIQLTRDVHNQAPRCSPKTLKNYCDKLFTQLLQNSPQNPFVSIQSSMKFQ